MITKLFLHLLAPCILVLYLMMIPLDMTLLRGARVLNWNIRTQMTAAHGFGEKLNKVNPATLKVDVLSFTRRDPLPEFIPACEDCSVITVMFNVTCTSLEGCEDLSVMDVSMTYESASPTLFYGDEFPNPSFQAVDYAGMIYGMQREFQVTALGFGETTRGEVSFTVKPDAYNFVLHFKHSYDDHDIAVTLVESNQ